MSEPRRLLDRDGDGGPAALLLSSARNDAPSAQSFDRVALRLGVAGTVLGAAALTGGAATAATAAASSVSTGASAGTGLAAGSVQSGAAAGLGVGAAAGAAGASAGGASLGAGVAGAGATVAKVAGVSLFTKLVGVAVVGLAVTGGAVLARHELASAPDPSVPVESSTSPKGLESVAQTLPGTPNAPVPTAKLTADDPAPALEATTKPAESPKATPEAPEAPKPSATSKPSSTAESPRETTLRDEVVLLDRARAEIARGATTEALATLAKHDATYPRGFLGSEAEVLRIEALVRAGRTAEATSRGEALLAREPNGPHAQRVRTLLGQ